MTETRSAPAGVEPRRWWVLAVMSVGTLLVFLDDTVVNTALPRIAVDLDASTSALQWVIDAYVLVLAGLLLLCGSIGDRYGRKRMMSSGLVVFGLAAAGAALANNTGQLIAMRALQGLGAALVLPATLSIIVSVFPRQERAKAIAVWTAVGGVGIVLFAMFVTFFFLTQYFQIVQGRSALEAGLLLVGPAIGMIVGSGIAGKLIHTAGPRVLSALMLVMVVAALVVLTVIIDTTTNGGPILLILGFFGLGAGLGMPALTDSVMAAVPERDAGVGSALNDVSRQLGGALGVAIIGSVVNDAYRSNLADHAGNLDPAVLHAAGEGIGIASRVAATLPPDAATQLTRNANDAFIGAITRGFTISTAVLLAALVVAVTMIPRRMRAAQAEAIDVTAGS